MAERTGLVDDVIQRHGREIRIAGRHVPCAGAGVVVDWRLVEEPIDREEERPAARVRPDEVPQWHAAATARSPGARRTVSPARLQRRHAVADAGAGMREDTLDEAGPRGPAGPRHGRSSVSVVDLAVAGAARSHYRRQSAAGTGAVVEPVVAIAVSDVSATAKSGRRPGESRRAPRCHGSPMADGIVADRSCPAF